MSRFLWVISIVATIAIGFQNCGSSDSEDETVDTVDTVENSGTTTVTFSLPQNAGDFCKPPVFPSSKLERVSMVFLIQETDQRFEITLDNTIEQVAIAPGTYTLIYAINFICTLNSPVLFVPQRQQDIVVPESGLIHIPKEIEQFY